MKKYGSITKKEIIFYSIYTFLLLLECWPGLWFGNSATPFVLRVPFFIFYQYAFVFLTVAIFVIQYKSEDKDGELEFDVIPGHDYIKDAQGLGMNVINKEEN